jgi:hypothetical protein
MRIKLSGQDLDENGEADPHLLPARARLLIAIAGELQAATSRIANMKVDW